MALKIVRWQGVLEIGAKRRGARGCLLAEDPGNRLVCRTRVLWIRAVVCLPRILEVGAEGFACRWRCRRILEVSADGDGRLLAEDLEVGAVLQ